MLMKVLLVNVDSDWNIALRRIQRWGIEHGWDVTSIDCGLNSYPSKKYIEIDANGYDRVYVSNIFNINVNRIGIVGCNWIDWGGVGSNFPLKKLPKEIDDCEPWYSEDEDTAVGFITRGCIRNCRFCMVPRTEGRLREYRRVEDIVGDKKKAVFLDNNILAYDKHEDVLRWLRDNKISCFFRQGLDIRLINDANAKLLSELKYNGEYLFAFDDPNDVDIIEEKLAIVKKYIPKPWRIRFFLYYNPDMRMEELIARAEWCREHECLPYVMRDKSCWDMDKDIKDFLTDYCAYCNQPRMFKKEDFDAFLRSRYTNEVRIADSSRKYHSFVIEKLGEKV